MVAPPKTQQWLLLLFSLSALIFFSYNHYSFPTFSDSDFTQSIHIVSHHVPNFTLIIKLLTFNRLNSLSRCLHSLAAADYLNDAVHLHVYIDHFVSKSSDADRLLEESRQILRFVDGFEWRFGQKLVHYRTGNVGLQAQWLEAWWPTSDNEFAFVVEDDLEVSPLFYKFLRNLIVNYYYNSNSNYTPSIYGASLQRPRLVPGKHGNKIHLDSGTNLLLYQLVGTWGQLLFPKPWKEFRLWYDEHKAKGIKPFLGGMVSTGWYKKLGERIWTPWFIKFIHSRGYFNIYTNFGNESALSVSHRDAGVNYRKSAGPDSQLLLDKKSIDKIPPLSELNSYDFCFRQVFPGRIVRSMDELGSLLSSLQKKESILLVSLFGAAQPVVRNLICHFERLNIRNYIFLGPHSDFLFDLARRGHLVFDADQFLNNINAKKYKSSTLGKEVLAKAYVVKKCLEYKYNTWVVGANLVLTSSDMLTNSTDYANLDIFYGGKNLELLFVRSSSSVLKAWTTDFIYKVVAKVEPGDSRYFADTVANLLLKQKDAGVRIRRSESTAFQEIGTDDSIRSSSGKMKMVYWSPEMGLTSVKRQLEEFRLWIIDDDFACTAVVCHSS